MLLWERGVPGPPGTSTFSIVLAHPYYTATLRPRCSPRAIGGYTRRPGDAAFLAEVLHCRPRCASFAGTRLPRSDDDSLIAIIQPDESGLDASPQYDVVMELEGVPAEAVLPRLRAGMQRLFTAYADHRTDHARLPSLDVFNWEDVMVNTIYADGLGLLGDLSRRRLRAERGERVRGALARVGIALEDKCWDSRAGVFWDLYGADEKRARTLTFTSLFPLALESLDHSMARRLVEDHLLNKREFWLPYRCQA